MKILTILGSPRPGGNSEVLLDAVSKGVELAGGEVETIRLSKRWIQPCLNCGGCDKTGECVLEDDMANIYDSLWTARRIILASPIYFYGVTAQTKAFIDRCQALWSRKRLLREKGEWQDDLGRKGFFVSVAATRGQRVFDGAILTVRYGFDAMGIHYSDAFFVRGIDELGAMNRHPDQLKAAEEFGRQVLA